MKLWKKLIVLVCLSSMLIGCDLSSQQKLIKKENSNKINEKIQESEVKSLVSKNEYKTKQENKIKDEEARILNVSYKRDNVTYISHISKSEMKEVLENTTGAKNMTHLSDTFVEAEEKYGVNAFFMAGIVALESGFATSRRAVEDNNLTGYEVYSDNSEGKLFPSQQESILQTARHLSENYLKEGAAYYKGLSVDAIQVSYCPDEEVDKNWEGKVNELSNSFLNTYNQLFKNNIQVLKK
ncbi:glucosaminidase domain-containing protein [Paraclostridium benzoelyticum]|uniref:glucosaminidase domain-containing protein n=1 Tax=Paraclostridium benzoelyticum TaxID=1629550 RepID=UPI0031CD3EA1